MVRVAFGFGDEETERYLEGMREKLRRVGGLDGVEEEGR
jgi:hypothetical protein